MIQSTTTKIGVIVSEDYTDQMMVTMAMRLENILGNAFQ